MLARIYKMKIKETIIFSVGGSLIAPDKPDIAFLKRLNRFVRAQVASGRRLVIIAGGGKTCRYYQAAAAKVVQLTDTDLDWLGIHATRLNGHLLRTIFRDIAYPNVVKDPRERPRTTKPVIIAAGWRPGCSTDYDAVLLAKTLGAKKVINLSNIDYVYDKDPNKYKDATRIKDIDWKSFRALLPKKWDPGLNAPFDPIAAREADKLGMEVAIINGTKLAQVDKYLKGEHFTGTLVS
jgi:uridylate kinase